MHGRPLPEHADLRKGRPAAAAQGPSSLAGWFHGVAVTSQEAQSRLRLLISAAGYLIKPIQRCTVSESGSRAQAWVLTNTCYQDHSAALRSAPNTGPGNTANGSPKTHPAASRPCHGCTHLDKFPFSFLLLHAFLLVCSTPFLLFWVLFGFAL